MPFGQVFIVQIPHKWYHVNAEITGDIPYLTCMQEIRILLTIECGEGGSTVTLRQPDDIVNSCWLANFLLFKSLQNGTILKLRSLATFHMHYVWVKS